jgi:general secretion pathway protein D/MSHA biogenesis protein MshL
MKKTNWCMVVSLLLLLAVLSACGAKKRTAEQGNKEAQAAATAAAVAAAPAQPAQLPARYQSPGYLVAREDSEADLGEEAEEYQIKVGATIRSTGGPQPLWDVLKRLAGLKGMTVSWASDVNQNALVDVDISSEDDFFAAIDNLLRQVDYFHEVKGKTIIVRYRETRVYQVGVPAMKGGYTTTVGGNFLGNRENKSGGSNTGTEGIVKITSDENEFDIWDNVKLNLDTILEVWSIRREAETTKGSVEQVAQGVSAEEAESGDRKGLSTAAENTLDKKKATGSTERSTQAYYTIDQSVGLISVTAPRALLEKVDQYINNLKNELYKQVSLEAKIIEVYLQDNSRIGLDWSQVLKNFSITGTTFFGTSGFGTDETGRDGQVYPWIETKGDEESPTRFVSKVAMNPLNFTVLLNALNEQGDTHVLANPKITVMNGQPALLSVGKDIAYIKTVTKDVDSDNNETTYTAEVDNVVQGVALGVMASVLENKKIILHLTPITTNLVGDEIPYRTFGDEGLEVGLPQINIRQMSTMVEVEDGEMLIIGGLIDSVEGKTGSFAPIVGSIPVIKYLFGVEEKRMEKRELVILLAPKII